MDTLLIVTFLIQALAITMILYTFHSISENKFPKLDALEKYHLMRKRYEHLRFSLLFVGALIVVQFAGLFYYLSSALPLGQLLISNAVVISLMIFLTGIYKDREHLAEMEMKK
jgi:hypothetical protein